MENEDESFIIINPEKECDIKRFVHYFTSIRDSYDEEYEQIDDVTVRNRKTGEILSGSIDDNKKECQKIIDARCCDSYYSWDLGFGKKFIS